MSGRGKEDRLAACLLTPTLSLQPAALSIVKGMWLL